MAEASAFEAETVAKNLTAYLRRRLGAEVTVSGLKRYTVGFSWITYGFNAAWRDETGPRRESLILRMGPLKGLFSPYSALPQFAALDSLAGSAVPVPKAYWWSDDPNAFGAPFFICERVEGEAPLPWVAEGREAFPPPLRDSLAEQFVAALAALHRFDWRGTRLATVGRGVDERSAAGEQIRLWEELLERWALQPYRWLGWGLCGLNRLHPVRRRASAAPAAYRTGTFFRTVGGSTAI